MQDTKCIFIFSIFHASFVKLQLPERLSFGAGDLVVTSSSGLHGYTHEHVSSLSVQQEREVLAKSIEVLTAFTGKKPKGWTAPAWATSPHSIQILEEAGIVRLAPSPQSI